ncbi:histidine phosphatase family protein [bacterium]|nr:MAG: histidine phosphatase family protein [bacterium]
MKTRFGYLLLFFGLLVSSPALAKSGQAAVDTNALASASELTGVYYALRHGESVPSSQHRVCATMETGTDPKNGLTPKGREEVITSTTEWIKLNKKKIAGYIQQDKLVVVTSPYSRTKESAEVFIDVLEANFKGKLPKKYRKSGLDGIIVVENDLREREFGKFEGRGTAARSTSRSGNRTARTPSTPSGAWRAPPTSRPVPAA